MCISVYYPRRRIARGTPSPTTSTVETVMDILHYSRSMHMHTNTHNSNLHICSGLLNLLKLVFSEVKLFLTVWISVEIVFLLSEFVCMKSNLCARMCLVESSLNYVISRRGLCQGLHINTPILFPTYSYSPDSEGFCCIYSFIAH